MVKKGDTLIEVTLAVGIFSMIAIAIVAVMSNGTAGAQTALETTLARESIDTQAEALRFIHDAAAADKDSASSSSGSTSRSSFYSLWTNIVKSASDPDGKLSNYAPSSCENIYNNPNSEDRLPENAFAIDTSKLGEINGQNNIPVSNVVVKNKLNRASTYPHLIYKSGNSDVDDQLVDNDKGTLIGAEGIFIVPVKSSKDNIPEFYDFYIRTCWYGTNADTPSTISTVIRLYNPDYTVKK